MSTPRGVSVHLMGAPRWRVCAGGSHALAGKDAALLAKLALDGPQPRQALLGLFWPDGADPPASLRQRASRLRAAAGVPFIELGPAVRLHPDLDLDIARLDALGDDVLLECAGLLAGVDLGEHGELDRWLAEARRRVAERCAERLAERVDAFERAGELAQALTMARRIVAWLPLAEQGWRRLMRLHYLAGDRAAAQECYWQLHRLLRDELGVPPSAETQQLAQTLEAAGAPIVPLPNRPVPASLLRPPVLVGRHASWAAMCAAWQHGPQPFLLVGEAGLGKSRLLEAFVQGHEGLVADRARPGDEQSPDALLGRLLVQVERAFAPPCSAAVRAELARLHPAFGEPPPVRPNVAIVRHALESMLAAALQCGLRGWVIDDLHNADRASLETLRWLAASPALQGLRLALATRPWPADGAGAVLGAWLADSQRPVRIELQPLSPAELRELLASLALPGLLDERLVTQLHRQAGGHPLYTLATLQDAMVRGVGLQQPGALQPPPSVHALLDARVRELPEGTRELLQVAAVGGADLSVERAARLLDCPPLALSDVWAQLEAANVLRGESFSHDLVHEAALRALPAGLRQALHRRWAALLQDEAAVPAARIAEHWERGRRPAEAARAWFQAGCAARLAGQLPEQALLFDNAARCHGEAGDRAGRFEALLARLEGLHLAQGGAAVLLALPQVEALADTTGQRARCRSERIEALLEQGRAAEAAAEAGRALDEAHGHPRLQLRLRAQLAIALAQSRQADAAMTHATRALHEARAQDEPPLVLKAANALMFVHWSAGRLADAVAAQREELAAAETLGDRAMMVASQISLAALLAGVGDVRATYEQARGARTRQQDLGLADNSTAFILNSCVLGTAAAALGCFDEALAALREAIERAGPDAAAGVRAKAHLAGAALWLVLGRADEARALAAQVPAQNTPPGMQMQAAWLLARAAEMAQHSPRAHWQRFDRLAAMHGELPVVMGVTLEASYRDSAPVAIERLRRAREEVSALALHGLARTLAARELARWLEVPGAAATEAALRLAGELEAHADEGLSARAYPPETWLNLARAHQRSGGGPRMRGCIDRARRWIDAASARMAPALRHAFAHHNAVNREVLAWPAR